MSIASAISTPQVVLASAVLVPLVIILNIVQFTNLNSAVRVIHQYPYTHESLERVAQNGELSYLKQDELETEQEIKLALQYLFGSDWADNGFYETHLVLRQTSLVTESHLTSLQRVVRPW